MPQSYPQPQQPYTPAAAAPVYSLSGVVTDLQGKAVPNATIVLHLKEGGAESRLTLYSGPDGRFAAGQLAAPLIDVLEVQAQGCRPTQISRIPLPVENLEVSLDRLLSAKLRVFFSSLRSPIPVPFSGHAEIHVFRKASEGSFVPLASQNATIPDGEHMIGGLEPAVYKAAVITGDEYAESDLFQVGANRLAEARVVIGRRQTLEGNVKGRASAKPVAGALVTLQAPLRAAFGRLPAADMHTTTAADGHFRIPEVVPGSHVLTISADGYSTVVVDALQVPCERQPPPAETYILTETYPSLNVKVTDRAGKPVFRAPLVLMPVSVAGKKSAFGETDSTGCYRFEKLVAGHYTVAATMPGKRARQKGLEVDVGERGSHEVELRFDPAVKITGQAWLKGKPYEGALSFVQRGVVSSKQFAKSDAEGMFAIELEPGEYIGTNEEQTLSGVIEVSPSERANVELRLNPMPGVKAAETTSVAGKQKRK